MVWVRVGFRIKITKFRKTDFSLLFVRWRPILEYFCYHETCSHHFEANHSAIEELCATQVDSYGLRSPWDSTDDI